jgi:hypothetical protein
VRQRQQPVDAHFAIWFSKHQASLQPALSGDVMCLLQVPVAHLCQAPRAAAGFVICFCKDLI